MRTKLTLGVKFRQKAVEGGGADASRRCGFRFPPSQLLSSCSPPGCGDDWPNQSISGVTGTGGSGGAAAAAERVATRAAQAPAGGRRHGDRGVSGTAGEGGSIGPDGGAGNGGTSGGGGRDRRRRDGGRRDGGGGGTGGGGTAAAAVAGRAAAPGAAGRRWRDRRRWHRRQRRHRRRGHGWDRNRGTGGASCTVGAAARTERSATSPRRRAATAAGDAACAAELGAGHVCVGGSCITGNCQTNADCTNGQTCNANTCGPCPTDASCGSGKVCVSGTCVTGNCHVADRLRRGPALHQQHLRSVHERQRLPVDVRRRARVRQRDVRVRQLPHRHRLQQRQDLRRRTCAPTAPTTEPARRRTAPVTCASRAAACRASAAAPPNCPTGEICTSTFTCSTCNTDAECVSGYGANHLCVSDALHRGRLPVDERLRRRAAVQHRDVHLRGPCTDRRRLRGRVRHRAPVRQRQLHLGDLPPGLASAPPVQVCDANNYSCRMCATDGECVAGYGPNHLCEGGACIPGQCRTSPECPNGGLCDAANHTCGAVHDARRSASPATAPTTSA